MIAYIPASRPPLRLAVIGYDNGVLTNYERAPGLSNNVRRLARVEVPDWDQQAMTFERRAIEHFRMNPADYQPEPGPEEPVAA